MPSARGSPKLFHFQYFDRNFVHFSHLFHAYYAVRLSILARYNYSTNKWWPLKWLTQWTMADANTRYLQRSRECRSRYPATSSWILTLLQSMERHLPMCVRTSIVFFFLVGNTCCYMALLRKLQINRMATSSIFLVSVKEGAMLQVVKQVFSERELLTLCHCPDHIKTNLS